MGLFHCRLAKRGPRGISLLVHRPPDCRLPTLLGTKRELEQTLEHFPHIPHRREILCQWPFYLQPGVASFEALDLGSGVGPE